MANERTYAILPCKELDDSIAFYETLGFKRTYRQIRPNPYAVVADSERAMIADELLHVATLVRELDT